MQKVSRQPVAVKSVRQSKPFAIGLGRVQTERLPFGPSARDRREWSQTSNQHTDTFEVDFDAQAELRFVTAQPRNDDRRAPGTDARHRAPPAAAAPITECDQVTQRRNPLHLSTGSPRAGETTEAPPCQFGCTRNPVKIRWSRDRKVNSTTVLRRNPYLSRQRLRTQGSSKATNREWR